MNSKLKLLYACLLTTLAWECGTDQLKSDPEYDDSIDREKDYEPIRIHLEFLDTRLPADLDIELRNSIAQYAVEWYSNVLKVQRIKHNLKIDNDDCDYGIPGYHTSDGVKADLVIYIRGQDIAENWVGRAQICLVEDGDVSRPLAGLYEMNIFYYQQLTYEERLSVLMHETAHILGFHTFFFDKYQKSSDKQFKLSEILDESEARDKEITYIKSPNLLNRARDAFKCSTLYGVELEDCEVEKKKSSHWEKRVMFNDFMTSSVVKEDIIYSDISLAFFQDFGWYEVDFTLTTPITFGKDEGCNFFTKKCVSDKGSEFPNSFCEKDNKFMCDSLGLQLSECNLLVYDRKLPKEFRYYKDEYKGGNDKYADYCPTASNYPDGNCRGYDNKRTYINPAYSEEACLDCRCLEYNLERIVEGESEYSAGCYRIECKDSTYDIIIGGGRVNCPNQGGEIQVPFIEHKNINRIFVCHPFEKVCEDVSCPYNCNGAGQCLKGAKCACIGGYSGEFCDLICYKKCKSCTGAEKFECASCYGKAELKEGECICPDNYKYEENDNMCVAQKCNSSCKKCNKYDADLCTACTEYAHIEPYGGKEGKCECDLGYRLDKSNYSCYECKQYLRSENITPYFSKDFDAIYMDFSRKAAIIPGLECKDVFDKDTLKKLGEDPVCEFKDEERLVVKLGYNPTILEEEIPLLPKNLFSSTDECTSPKAISVKVKVKYEVPIPKAMITAPKALSLDCGENLVVAGDSSTGGLNRGLYFNWQFTSEPSNKKLPTNSNNFSKEGIEVSIPVDDLIESDLTVKLTVMNAFGGKHSDSFVITIKKKGVISIVIQGGEKFTIYTNQYSKIDATLQNSCYPPDQITWDWKVKSVDDKSGSGDLEMKDFFIDSSLIFKPYTISAGHTYEFLVTAKTDSAVGNAAVNVKVLYPDIVVVLNKIDGEISVAADLYISASESYDPAYDKEQELKFEWKCSGSSDSECLNMEKKTLTFDSNTSEVNIKAETLQPDKTYVFEVTVSNGKRKSSKEVALKAVDLGSIVVTSNFSGGKVRSEDTLLIIPSITAHRSSTFLWTFSKGSIDTEISIKLPYISIPENTLTPGLTYTLDFLITDEYKKNLKTSFTWLVNLGPKGEDLELSSSIGKSLDTIIQMTARNFIDGDSEDLPLYYQFGAIVDETEYPFHSYILSNKYSTVLFLGKYEIFVKVCDSMFTCTIVKEKVNITGEVADSDCEQITQMFRDNTADLNKGIQNIVNYMMSYGTCEDFFNVAESKMESYMKDLSIPGSLTLDALASTVDLLLRDKPSMNPDQLESFTNFLTEIINLNQEYLKSNHALKIMNAVFAYYNEDNLTTVSKFNEFLLKIVFSHKLPDEEQLSSEIGSSFIYRNRIKESSLNDIELDFDRFKIKFSEDTPLPTGFIYDLQITGFPDANSKGDILDLALFKVGTYDNLNLVLEEKYLKQQVVLKNPMTITMPINVSENRRLLEIGCGCISGDDTSSEGCKIKDIKDGIATVSINRFCRITFKEPDPEDKDKSGYYSTDQDEVDNDVIYDPIYAMIAWLVLIMVIFGLFIYISKRGKSVDHEKVDYKQSPKHIYMDEELGTTGEIFLRYHLTFSIGSKLDAYRIPRLLTICTVILIEYCLVGILIRFLGNSEEGDSGKVLDDYGDVIGYVFISLTITLPYTTLVMVHLSKLNVFGDHNKQVNIILMAVIPAMVASIGGIVVLNVLEFKEGAARKWAVSIIWLILLEVFLYQSVISIILSCCEKILRSKYDKLNQIIKQNQRVIILEDSEENKEQIFELPKDYPTDAAMMHPKLEAIKVPKIKKRKNRQLNLHGRNSSRKDSKIQ